MLSKICLAVLILLFAIWGVSLTMVVVGGAIWALQKLGGM